ncbi:MAG TPA: undecaprenyldiphospho-muramoylpentapeptide beta-N-acetylglucosaminyltransferase [Spirochaetota bacterium]
MNFTKKSILIVGGGTGGHISPGIALYEECRAQGIDAYLLVGKNDLKFTYLREIGKEHLLVYGAPPFTKNPFKLPFFALRFFAAVFAARRLFAANGIECVIGMGGYVSAPALFAARAFKKPYWLCEQNTVPGKVTFQFAKKARALFTTFEDTKRFVKPAIAAKCVTVGNPVRKKVLVSIDQREAKKVFNLDHCEKVVLVIGGSQGALTLNELVVGIKTKFPEDFSRVGIIWCTGAQSFEKYRAIVREQKGMGSIFISPFVEDVGVAYRACDLAISRSGAGGMAEIAAMALPSILIPYPYAAADHQNKNADVFARTGAAIKIANADATPEKVAPVILDILMSEQKSAAMAKKVYAEGRIRAAKDIIEAVSK